MVSYFRLARWRTWVRVWLCCTVLGGGLLLGTTAAQAAPTKVASAKDVPAPTIPGDTGPATVWSCGGYRHNPSDFTSLSYGGDVGNYDVDGRYCDGSFSYVATPTSSTVTWPVVVNTADPNGTEADVWVWIPTLDASAIVNYAVTECKLETTNCVSGYLTQGFNQDPVSGWQFVGTVFVGAGYYVSQFTLSSADQQQNNMGGERHRHHNTRFMTCLTPVGESREVVSAVPTEWCEPGRFPCVPVTTQVFLLFEALVQYLLRGSIPEVGRKEKSISDHSLMRISDKFCQILKEVLPLSALAIQLNYPKTKDKFCRDSQN